MLDRVRQLALVALVVPLLAACGSDRATPRGWQGTLDTLPGGGVRVQNPDSGTWAAGEGWRLREEVRIGSPDSAGPALFGRIADLEADELGRIYVLDALAKELRVFGPDGRHVRTMGREGDGPGEFRDPTSLGWLPDGRLVVVDLGGGRFSVFDTAGTFLGQSRRELQRSFFPWRGAIDGTGRILDWVTARQPGAGTLSQLLVRSELRIAAPAAASPPARDTFYLALPEIEQLEMTIPGGVSSTAIPFGARLGWFIDGRRDAFWTTNLKDYRFVKSSLAGDTLLIVEKASTPVPVSDQERSRAVESLRAAGWNIDESKIPGQKPAVRSFAVDEQGYLWVAGNAADPIAFDVLDPQGLYLGSVPAPPELDASPTRPLRIRQDALYGIAHDSLGVEYVLRLRIERP